MPQLIKNTAKIKTGGARVGAGRKKKDVTNISVSIPTDQLKIVDEICKDPDKNRSKLYTQAMHEYLNKPPQKPE